MIVKTKLNNIAKLRRQTQRCRLVNKLNTLQYNVTKFSIKFVAKICSYPSNFKMYVLHYFDTVPINTVPAPKGSISFRYITSKIENYPVNNFTFWLQKQFSYYLAKFCITIV